MVDSNVVKTLTKRKFGHSFREKTTLKLREKTGIYKPKREALGETIPAVSGNAHKHNTHTHTCAFAPFIQNRRLGTWGPSHARQILGP